MTTDYAEKLFKIKQLEHKFDGLVIKIRSIRDNIGTASPNDIDMNEYNNACVLRDAVQAEICEVLEIKENYNA